MSYQLYRFPVLLFRFLGMIRAYTVYLPNYKHKPTIPEIEQDVLKNNKRDGSTRRMPVWMDRANPLYEHYDPKRPTKALKSGLPSKFYDNYYNQDKQQNSHDREQGKRIDFDETNSVTEATTGADESRSWDDFSSKLMSYASASSHSKHSSSSSKRSISRSSSKVTFLPTSQVPLGHNLHDKDESNNYSRSNETDRKIMQVLKV